MKNLVTTVIGPVLIIIAILLFFNASSLTEGANYKLGYLLIGIVSLIGIFLAAKSAKSNHNKFTRRSGILTLIGIALLFLLVILFFIGISNLKD